MFCYGSFVEILRSYFFPKINLKNLTNILLTSPLIHDESILRESHYISDAEISKFCSGKRDLPPHILVQYNKTDVLDKIKLCFSLEIIPHIQECERRNLINDMLLLIQQDDSLSTEIKVYFENLALSKDDIDFLAELFRFSLNRKKEKPCTENLPPQNNFFSGRDTLIDAIKRHYNNNDHILGLFGMGGVGKTQIALQYSYDNLKDYTVVCWINAETVFTMQNSISDFLSLEKCLPKDRDAESIRKAFLDYFNIHKKWLLVYNNAEYGTADEYYELEKYMPQNISNGNILMTTRCKNAFKNAIQIEVPVFSVEEAVIFLQYRTNINDQIRANQLAEQLGYHPLALEYAAAYINETPGLDYVGYIKRLEEYGIKLLDRRVGYDSYNKTIRETFHITLDRILEETNIDSVLRSEEQFLNICAFMAPQNIRINIFIIFNWLLPDPIRTTLGNKLDLDELLRKLTKYSLIQVDWNMISIHRLLQEVLLDEMNENDRENWIYIIYFVFDLYRVIVRQSHGDYKQVLLPLIPHVCNLLKRWVQIGPLNTNSRILDIISKTYFEWICYTLLLDGEDIFEYAQKHKEEVPILQEAEKFYRKLGCNNVYLAFILSELACINHINGNIQMALSQYNDAFDIAFAVLNEMPTPYDAFKIDLIKMLEPFKMEQDMLLYREYHRDIGKKLSYIFYRIGTYSMLIDQIELTWKSYIGVIKTVQMCVQYALPKPIQRMNNEEFQSAFPDIIEDIDLFSKRISGWTQRAFVLRIETPTKRLDKKGKFGGCICAFYYPISEVGFEDNTDINTGFDILLENNEEENIVKKLNTPWFTLAFPQDVRTLEEMLTFLVNIKVRKLNASAKYYIYSAICSLAGQLSHTDIAEQYEKKIRNLYF